jgi:hypothetical protein
MVFNILFVVHYYLFGMFNFFILKNNYLFILLDYLFPEFEISYLVLKNIFKIILCKYRQVWSYFEDLVIRKIMVQLNLIWMLTLISLVFLISELHACG